ncbi:uncharacterized mitochondrial protein AtMg00810-like [Hibiscus syriacus]|uniref:uncharacterized mitochondrial protein AtMg00810-like n=1 Tax=Hibiscus syriacus TaxID=106335 RepID=UPI0019226D1D|nr:uncharacterized mitochondrial protein AtMg00810-like [Hibiscus syriacus]
MNLKMLKSIEALLSHFLATKRVLRYFARTLSNVLVFMKGTFPLRVQAFADRDWGGNPDDRRLISGHCVFLGCKIVAWSSKKQKSVSRSTMEAEYRSVVNATAEVTWVHALLVDT